MNVATVGGLPVSVADVDARESRLRAGPLAASLPRPGTSEGRQLRRWLTQLLVSELVVQLEARSAGLDDGAAPSEAELLPDTAARLEVGSVAAASLQQPVARALFVHLTRQIRVSEQQIADYHARNPLRFAAPMPTESGWRTAPTEPPPLTQVRPAITEHLLGSARRQAFRRWLDSRRAALVHLAPGYEHPGDPRQPDNTHTH
ncbi:MAG: malonyl CoA-ACP transacylase [Mycobacterium sp.]